MSGLPWLELVTVTLLFELVDLVAPLNGGTLSQLPLTLPGLFAVLVVKPWPPFANVLMLLVVL